MNTKPHILKQILHQTRETRAQGQKFLAVFDLDSTLFDLTARVQAILKAFANDAKMIARFPQECEKLHRAQVRAAEWGINEALVREGLIERDCPKFFRELFDYWRFQFFSNRFLSLDVPLPGSVQYVHLIEKQGAEIMYLTARDIGRMFEGTQASLRQWNFPLDAAHVQLCLKADPCEEDAKFKLEILRKARTNYDRIVLFENEPVNLNLVKKELPDIALVFIDTTHSGREQAHPDLSKIPHFEVDAEEFREFLT